MEIIGARYGKNPEEKKPKRLHRKWAVIVCAFIFLLSTSGYTVAAMSKPLTDLSTQQLPFTPATPANITMPWPASGEGAIGSVEQGVLAVSTEGEVATPIASITKIITALALMQKAPLAENTDGITYTFTQEDVALYESYLSRQGSVVPITAGQTMTQRKAMEYLLIISANNLADSMVMRHFGSMESYIAYATNILHELGLDKTVVTDASGFSAGSVSTPSDLIKLGIAALKHPIIADIVTTRSINVPGYGMVNNTNQLLGDPGVVGIKTGTTDEAGRCLLFAAEHQIDGKNKVTIIGVVLGMPSYASLYQASRTVLEAAKQNFGETEIIPANTNVGIIKSAWGEESNLITSKAFTTIGWRGTIPEIETTLSPVDSTIAQHAVLGKIGTKDGSVSVDVVAERAIGKPSLWWRLKNYF